MKILLIDDHEMLSESLKISLEKSEKIERVDILQNIDRDIKTNIDKLKKKIFSKEYDIIIMDIGIKKITGDKDGLMFAKELLDKDNDLKIIILTGYGKPRYEEEAKEIGAKGFICKNEKIEVLIDKITKVYNKETVFKKTYNKNDKLTERELEILILYGSGFSRKEVAEKCRIATSTLSVTINKIYDKLGVRNYQEMVNRAIEIGYIKPNFF